MRPDETGGHDVARTHSESIVDAKGVAWVQVEPGVERQVLAWTPALMLVRVRLAAGAVGAMHHHPHRQASYVAAGSFEVRIGDLQRIVREGDSFIVEPDVEHGVVALEAGMLVDVFTPARETFLPAR